MKDILFLFSTVSISSLYYVSFSFLTKKKRGNKVVIGTFYLSVKSFFVGEITYNFENIKKVNMANIEC